MRYHILLPVCLALLATAATASAQRLPQGCGSLDNAYGPFDYTNPRHFREMLPRVEGDITLTAASRACAATPSIR